MKWVCWILSLQSASWAKHNECCGLRHPNVSGVLTGTVVTCYSSCCCCCRSGQQKSRHSEQSCCKACPEELLQCLLHVWAVADPRVQGGEMLRGCFPVQPRKWVPSLNSACIQWSKTDKGGLCESGLFYLAVGISLCYLVVTLRFQMGVCHSCQPGEVRDWIWAAVLHAKLCHWAIMTKRWSSYVSLCHLCAWSGFWNARGNSACDLQTRDGRECSPLCI